MSPAVDLKDPDATLLYSEDWADYLASGVTIVSSVWSIDVGDSAPTALAILSEDLNGTIATVKISGGTKGEVYTLTNRIVTSEAETDDRSRTIRVEPQ